MPRLPPDNPQHVIEGQGFALLFLFVRLTRRERGWTADIGSIGRGEEGRRCGVRWSGRKAMRHPIHPQTKALAFALNPTAPGECPGVGVGRAAGTMGCHGWHPMSLHGRTCGGSRMTSPLPPSHWPRAPRSPQEPNPTKQNKTPKKNGAPKGAVPKNPSTKQRPSRSHHAKAGTRISAPTAAASSRCRNAPTASESARASASSKRAEALASSTSAAFRCVASSICATVWFT